MATCHLTDLATSHDRTLSLLTLKANCDPRFENQDGRFALIKRKIHYVHWASKAYGGGNSLRPYSQQRPMSTNLSCCLGLIDNGQYKSTNRLLVVVPHERPHGIMRIPKIICMLLPKAPKLRAIKDTMALVADSIGGTKGAPAHMSWHLRHLNPALLNWQGMSTHPKMEQRLLFMLNQKQQVLRPSSSVMIPMGAQILGHNDFPLQLTIEARREGFTLFKSSRLPLASTGLVTP